MRYTIQIRDRQLPDKKREFTTIITDESGQPATQQLFSPVYGPEDSKKTLFEMLNITAQGIWERESAKKPPVDVISSPVIIEP